MISQLLFARVLPSGSVRLLVAMAVFSVCVSVSVLLVTAVKDMIQARIETKLSISVDAASMMRIMSLPADFFKPYSAGELAERASQIGVLCKMLASTVLSTGFTSLFSLIYISQIFAYAPALVVPALVIILVTVVFSLLSTFVQMKVSSRQMELSGKESGMTYALISGIQKIRLAGAEKRAFARWGNLYTESARLTYDPPAFLKLNAVISLAISLTGTIVMYYMAVQSGISVADYYAFDTAYGMVSGAFMSLAGMALSAAQIKPILAIVKPFFDAVPEVSDGKQVLTRLSGGIELSHVSFRYNDTMPLVIDDLSLKIRPGQYVAIVGKTGCGKSTLLRLLLGFEKPQKGAVYYDVAAPPHRRGDAERQAVSGGHLLQHRDLRPVADPAGRLGGGGAVRYRRRYTEYAHGYEHGDLGGLRRHIRRAKAAADDRPCYRAQAQDPDV